MQDYEDFFRALLKQLNERGMVALAVPDCLPYLESGDISFLFHEHWSYFTPSTLTETLERHTKLYTEWQHSGFGGTIYATCYMNRPTTAELDGNPLSSYQIFQQFIQHHKTVLTIIDALFKGFQKQNQTVGIFVPARIINVLAKLKPDLTLDNIRFFDDNPSLRNTYYPGFNIKVENRADLLANQPNNLIIMSHTFGPTIALSLRKQGFHSKIITWNEIFSPNS